MKISDAFNSESLDAPAATLPKQKHQVRIALVSHILRVIRGNEERMRLERSVKPHEKYCILPLAKKVTPYMHQGIKRVLRGRLPSDPVTTTQALRYIKILKVIGNWLARQNAMKVPGLNYFHQCIIVAGRYLFVATRDAGNILNLPEETRRGVEGVCKIAKEELDRAADRYRASLKGECDTASSSKSVKGKGSTASAALGGLLLASRTAVRRKTAEKKGQKAKTVAAQNPKEPSPKEKLLRSAMSRGIQIGGAIGLEVFKDEAIRGISALETTLRQKGIALAADRSSYFALHQLTKLALRITFIYGASCVFQQIAPTFLSQSLPFLTVSIYKIANIVLWANLLMPTISDLHDEYEKECDLSPPTGLPTRDQFASFVREFIRKILEEAQEKQNLLKFRENFEERISATENS